VGNTRKTYDSFCLFLFLANCGRLCRAAVNVSGAATPKLYPATDSHCLIFRQFPTLTTPSTVIILPSLFGTVLLFTLAPRCATTAFTAAVGITTRLKLPRQKRGVLCFFRLRDRTPLSFTVRDSNCFNITGRGRNSLRRYFSVCRRFRDSRDATFRV